MTDKLKNSDFRVESNQLLSLKPMATAPRPTGDEYFKLLVLDEWNEGGEQVQDWVLVYWLDAWDEMPAGWYGNSCGDLRHPIGWILCTASLPTSPDSGNGS